MDINHSSAPKAINPTKILTEQDAEDAANEILRRSTPSAKVSENETNSGCNGRE